MEHSSTRPAHACAHVQHGAQQRQSRAWAAEPWAHAGAAPPLSSGRRLPPHCLMHTHTYTSCTRVTPPVSLRRPLRLPPARSPLPLPSARCLPPPPQLRPQLRPSASVLSPRPVLHPPPVMLAARRKHPARLTPLPEPSRETRPVPPDAPLQTRPSRRGPALQSDVV